MNESTESRATNVSKSWLRKFERFERIGADKEFVYKAMSSNAYEQLSLTEKRSISFNALAFFLGPLYYFFKGMWAKGAAILAVMWIAALSLALIEWRFLTDLPEILFWITTAVVCGQTAVVCSQLASYDYYRKVALGETIWGGWPVLLSKPAGAILFPVVAFAIMVSAATMSSGQIRIYKLILFEHVFEREEMQKRKLYDQTLEDVSGFWRSEDGVMVRVDLVDLHKTLRIDERTFPVVVSEIDTDNSIISLEVTVSGDQQASWALRQMFSSDGRFTLLITLHSGTQEELSYVRNL